jgi:hypothetical protein
VLACGVRGIQGRWCLPAVVTEDEKDEAESAIDSAEHEWWQGGDMMEV